MASEQKAGTVVCFSWNEKSPVALGARVMVAVCDSIIFLLASICEELSPWVLIGIRKIKLWYVWPGIPGLEFPFYKWCPGGKKEPRILGHIYLV